MQYRTRAGSIARRLRSTMTPFGTFRVCRFVVVSAAALGSALAAQPAPAVAAPEADTPQAVWERMIESKGGRRLLHSIRSIFIEERARAPLFRRGTQIDALYVIPDKVWLWDDEAGSPSISVANRALGECWAYRSGFDEHAINAKGQLPGFIQEMENFQMAVLLETAFVQPRPVSYRVVREGLRKRGLLEARWNGVGVRYYIDLKTMLPVRVSTEYIPRVRDGHEYSFSDYVRVEGIPVPRQARHGVPTFCFPWRWSITFNVKHSDDIFERPPRRDEGRHAWRMTAAETANANRERGQNGNKRQEGEGVSVAEFR